MAETMPNKTVSSDPTHRADLTPPAVDPAAKSLADALRVSFRLLTVIMVAVVVAFLLTGLKSVQPQEVGIIKVFGKVEGTVGQGLAYTWPFPVGQIEIVSVKEQTITVNDLWLDEQPKDQTKPLHERRPTGSALRPGWDGAVLTGDRNLIHVKPICTYKISGEKGARLVVEGFAAGKTKDGLPGTYMDNLGETIRSLICETAIHAAGKRTADDISRLGKTEFVADIKRETQRRLNELTRDNGQPFEAVKITSIGLDVTWPLFTLSAYQAAQRAVSQKEEIINRAIADARKTLNEAAGATHEMLAGSPKDFMGVTDVQLQTQNNDEPYNLIGQYTSEKDPVKAARLLTQIEQIVASDRTGGEASRIFAEAKAYKTVVIQNAESRAKRFNDLLGGFESAPQFMLERLWADVRDEILSSPTVEKHFLTPGQGKTILRINSDPEVLRAIRRELQKQNKKASR